jgi:outer membrane protein OmpA-like peptidoglycan-associated protein
LSRRRALAVRAALIAAGVEPGRISIAAHGERRPLVATADGVPEAQNRFVTILPPYSCRGRDGERFC